GTNRSQYRAARPESRAKERMSRKVGGVSRSPGMSSSANAASSIRSCSSSRTSEASRGSVACAELLIASSPAVEEAEVDVQAEEHAAADHQEQAGKHGGGGDAGDPRRDLLRLAPQELGVVPADVVADGHQRVGERCPELLG